MNIPADLIVGDTLLYTSHDLIDLGIEIKEADDVAHVEVYAGNNTSYASRNGIGVNVYPFRPDGLMYVRRNRGGFNQEEVEKWFNGVKGLAYGWGDIISELEPNSVGLYTTDLTQYKGVDCSHFAAALQEVAQTEHFDPMYPKNKISPRDFKLSLATYNICLNH